MNFFWGKYLELSDCYGCGLQFKMCDLEYDQYSDGWYCHKCCHDVVCAGCGSEYPKHELTYHELYNAHYCKYCSDGDD